MQTLKKIGFKGAVIALLFLALVMQHFRHESSTQAMFSQLNKANMETIHFKTKDGLNGARIQTLEGNFKDLQGMLVGMNETTQQLVKQLNKNTTSASVFSSTTTTSASGKTETVSYPKNDSLPEYKATLVKPWVTYKMRMNKDSAFVTSVTKNDFLVNSYFQNHGFLNLKSTLVTDVTATNPDTGIDEVRSFQKKAPKRKIVVSGGVTFGLTPALQFQPALGIHVGVPIAQF